MCHLRFTTTLALLILLTALSGCDRGVPSTSGSAPSSSSVRISETGHRTFTDAKTFESNFCNTQGTSANTLDYKETFSVNVEGSGGLTVGLEAVKASVTAKYGEGKETTMVYHYSWPAEKNTRLTLTWTWQEWTGDLFTDSGQGKFVARLPIEVKQQAVDLGCPVLDVLGVWLTPFNNLTYEVTKKDQTQIRWLIRESGANGTGTIDSKTLVGDIDGQKVIYEVGEWDSQGKPTVLYTTHPNFFGVILFRTCSDFGKYLTDVGKISPQMKTLVTNAVKSVTNPTCPNVLP